MTLLASLLSGLGRLGRPVVDETGITGRVDFSLEWTPEPGNGSPPAKDVSADAETVTFLDALREQLGLKLESTKAPLQTLIVDHVERPSEN